MLLAGSQQTSPTASASHTSLPQPTIFVAFSAIVQYEKKLKRYKDRTSTITYSTAKDTRPVSPIWSGRTSEPHQVLQNHIRSYRTTSGLTEPHQLLGGWWSWTEQLPAVFTDTEASSSSTLYLLLFSIISVEFSELPLKCLRHVCCTYLSFYFISVEHEAMWLVGSVECLSSSIWQ